MGNNIMAVHGESQVRKAAVKIVQTVRHDGQTARSLRFVLPLAAGLIISSCGPCQETQKEGVKPMGDSEQKTGKKEAQQKGTVFLPGSTSRTSNKNPAINIDSLTIFNPYFDYLGRGTGNIYYEPDYPNRGSLRASWAVNEDKINPFNLSDKNIAEIKKNPEGYGKLLRNWEGAKDRIRVALLTDKKGVSPENAFETHSPEEIRKYLVEWPKIKSIQKAIEESALKH